MLNIPLPTIRQILPLPMTAQAIHACALYVQAAWAEAARSGRYVGVGTGSYANGILTAESLVWPLNGDDLAAMVVNVAPHAFVIEHGAPGFHLPSVIRWAASRAARRSKKGYWFIRVPFRHSVPREGAGMTSQAARTMMPQEVYARAKQLQAGQRLGNAGLPAYRPNMRNFLARPGYKPQSIYAGMQKRGAPGHSQYMTFRTITERSMGWNIPPRAGAHIAESVAQETRGQIREMITTAFAQDIAAYLQQSLGGK